ncbi:histidine triad nucleotide-binding protein [Actinopolyspora erythraea]|uniref:HIT family hydrolase n=1 Tax=Actinopolyspora erythraea TaxID=414996 RepID=A0A099D0H7_9ACTN|nr:histidine triad nucleotide-binding protein [Actinopolyspora erythraea]ASU77965.1 histidine triad nucleotide-binding protein [Actinopolyspora erythraea]KGI79728.1 HIT family hydrolase [Actinopolyspora erythraea]
MTESEPSLFERMIAGEIPADFVHSDERTIAIRDINPQAPVHVLVVPRERYRNAAELAAADPGLLAELFRVAARIAESEGVAESGYRLLFNTNADAGQTIFHVHLHLLGGRELGPLA